MQRATTLIMQQVLRQRMQCLVSNSRLPVATFTHHHQQQQHRYAATSTVTSKQATPPPRHDWNRAVSEAERIVGYPTSFLSLRWLLSDEIANVALHLRKLVGSAHPLMKTAKHLLYNGKNTMQAWGLIVLLVSKAGGHAANIPDVEQDKSAGVLHSQRALAEVTEMIRISHLVHNSVVNLQSGTQAGQDGTTFDDMSFGNKIGLLTGDYLLGHSSAELANLRNQEVVELISSAVRDFSESEFIGERDEQNNPLPFKPGTFQRPSLAVGVDFNEHDVLTPMPIGQVMGNPEQEWECRNILNAGSLLGKSCQASLKLAQQSEEMQRHAYRFGKHLALAWQACLDAEIFQTPVRDFSESEFIGERDEQNNPLPFKPGTFQRPSLAVGVDFNEHDVLTPMPIGQVMGNPEQEWECRNILNAGSLLGKSCQASLKLAQQSEEMQRHAYRFGKHLALAWQACLDAEIFQTPTLPLDAQFSLVSAPVLFHLEHDPSMYALLEKGKQTVENIDYHKIHKIVIAGPALAKTKELQCKHTAAALTVLQHFPATDARQALENIILAMQDL
ncbi:hypothetical protein KR215_008206 [Drosophila sulfurigaster]|nr:hypothetical protein KR215_008206 [Drosophila sulfurigaster]